MNENIINDKKNKLDGAPVFLTVQDVMEHLKIGRNKAYKLVNLRGFPKLIIGSTYRIPKDEYIKWISKNVSNHTKIYL